MKKVLWAFFLFLFSISCVHAEEYTLDDFVTFLHSEENPLYSKMDGIIKFEVEHSASLLDPNFHEDHLVGTALQSKNGYTVSYDYKDGVLTYEYQGKKDKPYDIQKGMYDSLVSRFLIQEMALFHGLSVEHLSFFLPEYNNIMSFSEDGLEVKTFHYEFSSSETSSDGEIIESMKIDINNFNEKKLIGEEENPDIVIPPPIINPGYPPKEDDPSGDDSSNDDDSKDPDNPGDSGNLGDNSSDDNSGDNGDSDLGGKDNNNNNGINNPDTGDHLGLAIVLLLPCFLIVGMVLYKKKGYFKKI